MTLIQQSEINFDYQLLRAVFIRRVTKTRVATRTLRLLARINKHRVLHHGKVAEALLGLSNVSCIFLFSFFLFSEMIELFGQ